MLLSNMAHECEHCWFPRPIKCDKCEITPAIGWCYDTFKSSGRIYQKHWVCENCCNIRKSSHRKNKDFREHIELRLIHCEHATSVYHK